MASLLKGEDDSVLLRGVEPAEQVGGFDAPEERRLVEGLKLGAGEHAVNGNADPLAEALVLQGLQAIPELRPQG